MKRSIQKITTCLLVICLAFATILSSRVARCQINEELLQQLVDPNSYHRTHSETGFAMGPPPGWEPAEPEEETVTGTKLLLCLVPFAWIAIPMRAFYIMDCFGPLGATRPPADINIDGDSISITEEFLERVIPENAGPGTLTIQLADGTIITVEIE